MTWAGGEAGTRVPRLFSFERTAARDPAFGAGGSACIPIRASPIFHFSFFLFASLAFCFGVSSSPPFLPAGPWKGGRCSQLTKAAGGEGRSGRGVCGREIRSSARRGSYGAGGRDSRAPGRRVAAQPRREVGGEWRIPAQAFRWPSHYVPQIGELCLAFPKGLGRQLCRGDPSPSPPPATHTPFRAVAHWFLGC